MSEQRLCPAGATLINQIDRRWPNRDASLIDDTDSNAYPYNINISEHLFGRGRGKQHARKLADDLAAYCREGKDGGRIAYIEYDGQIATNDEEDWKFHGSGHGIDNRLNIVFFPEHADNDDSTFELEIFRFFEDPLESEEEVDDLDPMMYLNVPKYPGKSSVKYGQKNDHVREVQFQLIKKGFLKSLPTGEYNDETASAVKEYLKYSGVNVDGKEINEAAWRRIIGGYRAGVPNGKLD